VHCKSFLILKADVGFHIGTGKISASQPLARRLNRKFFLMKTLTYSLHRAVLSAPLPLTCHLHPSTLLFVALVLVVVGMTLIRVYQLTQA
jgi:hypothetical protein